MRRSRVGLVLTVLLIVMNTLDAAVTLWWWNAGLAEEANPLMRHLLQMNPSVAMTLKALVVNSLFLWIWATSVPTRLPRTFAAICTVYTVIMYLHLAVLLEVL